MESGSPSSPTLDLDTVDRWQEQPPLFATRTATSPAESLWSDLTGTPYSPTSEWIGVVARRT